MVELAYIEGRFCPLSEAKVPIEDRGYQFGDGVYEVVVAHGRHPFRLQEHLDRLAASLKAVRIDLGTRLAELPKIIEEGIERAGFPETLVYLQVTRGVAPRTHVPIKWLAPVVVATFRAKSTVPPELQKRGLYIRTMPEIRWSRCHIKAIALLPAVMAKMEAMDDGYDDAVFVNADGEVLEATAANVFVIKDSVLWTPPTSEHILHGITRGFVLECATRLGIRYREDRLMLSDLRGADEVFLSSTSIDILAATQVDGVAIGHGRPGPITTALNEAFRKGMREEQSQKSVASLA